jgi:hypothetical protein
MRFLALIGFILSISACSHVSDPKELEVKRVLTPTETFCNFANGFVEKFEEDINSALAAQARNPGEVSHIESTLNYCGYTKDGVPHLIYQSEGYDAAGLYHGTQKRMVIFGQAGGSFMLLEDRLLAILTVGGEMFRGGAAGAAPSGGANL